MPRVVIEYTSTGEAKVIGGLKGIQKETGGLAKSASKMGDVFKTAFGNIIANLATGALSAFTGALKGSLDAFLGYEKGLVQFKAISGATEADMSSLADEVTRLGSVTPKSAGEISEMTVSLARAGLNAQQAEQALNGIVQGSIASGESLENFGSILATTANVFGFFEPGMIDFLGDEITDTGEKFDKATALIVAGANSSNQSVADLGAAMKNMGGAVTTANKGLEDGIYLTQVLAQTGVVGGEAGTVGKNIFNTLTEAQGLMEGTIESASAMSTKAANVFKKYGISLSDANGELLDAPELMARISSAFQSIENPAERAAFATEAFGRLHGSKIAAALGLSLTELERLNAGLLNNELAFAQTSDVMQEGFGGAIARMQSALEGLQIQLAGAIAPALTLATDLFTGFMNSMGEAASQVQGLDLLSGIYDQVVTFGQLIGQSVGQILAQFITLGTNIMQNIAPSFSAFATAAGDRLFSLANIIEVIIQKINDTPAAIAMISGLINAVLGIATTMTTIVTDAINFLFDGFMSLGDIELPGIGELVETWKNNFQEFGEVAGSAFDAIVPKVQAVASFLGENLGGVFGGIIETVVVLGQALGDAFGNIMPALQAFGSELYDRIQPAFEGLTSAIANAFGIAQDGFPLMQNGLSGIIAFLTHIVTWLLESEFLIGGISRSVNFLVGLVTVIVNVLSVASQIVQGIAGAVGFLVGKFMELYNIVSAVVSAIASLDIAALGKLLSGDIAGFLAGAKGEVQELKQEVETIGDGVNSQPTNELTDALKAANEEAAKLGKDGVSPEFINSQRELLETAKERAKTNDETIKQLKEEQKQVQSITTASAEERKNKEAKLKSIRESLSALQQENKVIKEPGNELSKVIAGYDSQLGAYTTTVKQQGILEEELTDDIESEAATRKEAIQSVVPASIPPVNVPINADVNSINPNAINQQLEQNPGEMPVDLYADGSGVDGADAEIEAARKKADDAVTAKALELQYKVADGTLDQAEADAEISKLKAEVSMEFAVSDEDKIAALKEVEAAQKEANQILKDAIDEEVSLFKSAQSRKSTALDVQKLAIQDNVNGYEAQVRAIEMSTKLLESQKALLEASFSIEEARANLENAVNNAQLSRLDTAQNISKELEDENLNAEKRKRLEQELTRLGFAKNADSLKILEAKNRKEAQIDQEKKAQQEAEFTRELAINDLEAQRNLQVAKRAELEAKISAMKAEQDILSAQQDQLNAQVKIKEAEADIQKAKIDGDEAALAAAYAKLEAANFEMDATKQQIGLAQQIAKETKNNIGFMSQEVANTQKINAAQREQIKLQQEAKRVELERQNQQNSFDRDVRLIDAKIDRIEASESAATEAGTKAGKTASKAAQKATKDNPINLEIDGDISPVSELDKEIKKLETEVDIASQLGLDTTDAQSELDALNAKKAELVSASKVDEDGLVQAGLSADLAQKELEIQLAQNEQSILKTALMERQLEITMLQLQLQTQLAKAEADTALAEQEKLVSDKQAAFNELRNKVLKGDLFGTVTQEDRDKLKELEAELLAENEKLESLQSQSEIYDNLAEKAMKLSDDKADIANTDEALTATEQALLDLETRRAEQAERTLKAKKGMGATGNLEIADIASVPGRRMGGLVQDGRLYQVAESGRELLATPQGLQLLSGDKSGKTYLMPGQNGYVHNASETRSILAGKRAARYGHSVGSSLVSMGANSPANAHSAKVQALLVSIDRKLDKLKPELEINGLSIQNTISSLSDLRVANIAENKLIEELQKLKSRLSK